jgi:hypothetical protein
MIDGHILFLQWSHNYYMCTEDPDTLEVKERSELEKEAMMQVLQCVKSDSIVETCLNIRGLPLPLTERQDLLCVQFRDSHHLGAWWLVDFKTPVDFDEKPGDKIWRKHDEIDIYNGKRIECIWYKRYTDGKACHLPDDRDEVPQFWFKIRPDTDIKSVLVYRTTVAPDDADRKPSRDCLTQFLQYICPGNHAEIQRVSKATTVLARKRMWFCEDHDVDGVNLARFKVDIDKDTNEQIWASVAAFLNGTKTDLCPKDNYRSWRELYLLK